MNDIFLAYPGVHQIFQLALAAHESGRLEQLVCTAVDLPGKIGSALSRLIRMPSAHPLGLDRIPPDRIREFPWPVVAHRLGSRVMRWRRSEHLHSNSWFDRHVARLVGGSHARVFVGSETSALHSFRAARDRGMTRVLDCPGIPAWFLDEQAGRAAAELGLPGVAPSNSREMSLRKERELELADVILVSSEMQKRLLDQRGVGAERVRVNPLWVDAAWWGAPHAEDRPQEQPGPRGPLKVLYAGAISLRKGVPYLVEAMRLLGGEATLTMVGSESPELRAWLTARATGFRRHAYLPKAELRGMFHSHDVLVMPSLGDSFGFVALEAMAAGMPVVVSAHCGVPVPDDSWRVPAASAEAIASRLGVYVADRRLVTAHEITAREFAARFTPERYRAEVRRVYETLPPRPE